MDINQLRKYLIKMEIYYDKQAAQGRNDNRDIVETRAKALKYFAAHLIDCIDNEN